MNLQDSGPYNYRPAVQYFTTLAQGFAVEVGTPSLVDPGDAASLHPRSRRWPLGDTYAYHDWHFGGNGDTGTFMPALADSIWCGASLADFERKAQLLDYVPIAPFSRVSRPRLWTRNSARLLWMTHPAWPSNAWQIYSSDYDAAGGLLCGRQGVRTVACAAEPAGLPPAVVNMTRDARAALALTSEVFDLQGKSALERVDTTSRPPPTT